MTTFLCDKIFKWLLVGSEWDKWFLFNNTTSKNVCEYKNKAIKSFKEEKKNVDTKNQLYNTTVSGNNS